MKKLISLIIVIMMLLTVTVNASNPIIKTDNDGNRVYAGDPAAIVVDDTVYLFMGHDTSKTNYYYMPDYLCYSSKDMINWTYEGVPMSAADFSWGKASDAWAGEVEYHKGKYYFFMCKNSTGISVGVSDNVTGPYKDALNGDRLVYPWWTNGKVGWDDIDPTVWIENDENGIEHRYICWGNSNCYIAELTESMTSLVDLNGDGKVDGGDITELQITNIPEFTGYTEAPYIYKRGDIYYLFFASNWHEELSYATSDSVTGPYEYGGKLMPAGGSSNTNHPAVIDFKGKTYIFYHTGALEWGSGYRRSICVDELNFNPDGSIDLFHENSTGLDGTKVYLSPVSDPSKRLYHTFTNTHDETAYPSGSLVYCDEPIANEMNSWWEIIKGRGNEEYVSIQSVNPIGYFITDYNSHIKLLHDNDGLKETAETMTFIKCEGLSGKGVSFQSMTNKTLYLTVSGDRLTLSNGYDKENASFIVTEVDNPDKMELTCDDWGIHLKGVYTGNKPVVILCVKDSTGKTVDFKLVNVNSEREIDYTYIPKTRGMYTLTFGKFSASCEY